MAIGQYVEVPESLYTTNIMLNIAQKTAQFIDMQIAVSKVAGLPRQLDAPVPAYDHSWLTKTQLLCTYVGPQITKTTAY